LASCTANWWPARARRDGLSCGGVLSCNGVAPHDASAQSHRNLCESSRALLGLQAVSQDLDNERSDRGVHPRDQALGRDRRAPAMLDCHYHYPGRDSGRQHWQIDWSQAWSSAGGGTRLASSAATHRRHATTATDAANRSLSGTPAECSADAKPAQRAVRCDGMIYCAARCEIRAMRCDEMR
jgi:hypothetical protein